MPETIIAFANVISDLHVVKANGQYGFETLSSLDS